jgi:hypothetical protein
MRPVHIYLAVYFALLIGAGLALGQAGIIGRIPTRWVVLAALGAAILGLLLALTSTRPVPSTPADAE